MRWGVLSNRLNNKDIFKNRPLRRFLLFSVLIEYYFSFIMLLINIFSMNIQKLINLFSLIYKYEPYTILVIASLSIISYFVYDRFFKKSFLAKKILVIGTIANGLLILILAIADSVLQGLIWASDPHSIVKALTPPFTPFGYIASYVWMHFLAVPIFCIVGAVALFYLLKLINKIGQDRFFYEEEYWLAALGCLAVGWPNLILYFYISMILGVLIHLIALIMRQEGRISLIYMWPVAMIITVIFGNKIAILTGLVRLKP